MIQHLFYMIGILFLILEILIVLNPTMATAVIEDTDNWAITLPLTLSYLLWIAIGVLAASQWIMFFVLFCLGIITTLVKRKSSYNKSTITCIDAILSIAIIGYLIANHFHHFDLF